MEIRTKKFKAFDLERKEICNVFSIILSDLNGREKGKVELNNGCITFWKNYLKEECILLEFTDYKDSEKEEIYENDLLEDEEGVYRVIWHTQQTCWWLSPILNKKGDDDMIFHLNNQQLGNGYYSRKDMKKIGNFYTHPQTIKTE